MMMNSLKNSLWGAHAARVLLSAARRNPFRPFFIRLALCLVLFGGVPLAWAQGNTLGIEKARKRFLKLCAAPLFLFLSMFSALADSDNLTIEKIMRGIQVRYNASGRQLNWPARPGDLSAPAYPYDGYYGDVTSDPAFYNTLLNAVQGAVNESVFVSHFVAGHDGDVGGSARVPFFSSTPQPGAITLPPVGGLSSSSYGTSLKVLDKRLAKLNWLAANVTVSNYRAHIVEELSNGWRFERDGHTLCIAGYGGFHESYGWKPSFGLYGWSTDWFSSTLAPDLSGVSNKSYITFLKYSPSGCGGAPILSKSVFEK